MKEKNMSKNRIRNKKNYYFIQRTEIEFVQPEIAFSRFYREYN